MNKVISALSFIPSSDREVWVKMGMAIKNEFGDLGFDIWDEWSQDDGSYNRASAKAVWNGIRATKVSIKSLYYQAIKNGWKDTEPEVRISAEEQRKRQEAAEKRRKADEAFLLRNQKRAAEIALNLWKQASPVVDNLYLIRKQVETVVSLREIDSSLATKILGYAPNCDGVSLTGKLLIVPIKVGSSLSSVEMIDADGRKSSIAGGAKASGYWAAQQLPVDSPETTIAIGEGVATMLSVKQATGFATVAALSHHNLEAVAKVFKASHPTSRILIAGDLTKKTGEPDPVAVKAANVTKVSSVFPVIKETDLGLTDFNDVQVTYGLQAVKDLFISN
jgi:putative DNA primase/helicase